MEAHHPFGEDNPTSFLRNPKSLSEVQKKLLSGEM
jgi:hypothetical protein